MDKSSGARSRAGAIALADEGEGHKGRTTLLVATFLLRDERSSRVQRQVYQIFFSAAGLVCVALQCIALVCIANIWVALASQSRLRRVSRAPSSSNWALTSQQALLLGSVKLCVVVSWG